MASLKNRKRFHTRRQTTKISCLLIFGPLLVALAFAPPVAAAPMTCFCKVSSDNLSGVCHPSPSQILVDLTGAVNTQYPWPRNNTKWQDCKQKCSDAAKAAENDVAAKACAAGVASGTVFHAYAALGNCGKKGEYALAQTFGQLINTPAVTETSCTCPQGWTPNAPKCKTTAPVGGIHYPGQTCTQSKASFEAGALSMAFFTTKCAAPTTLLAVNNVSCQDTPIPGFNSPGDSVYSATACCGIPGVTTDGRCKKVACQPNTVTPYPSNGLPIGTQPPAYGTSPNSWGFSWGNAFIAWGTAPNGGMPTNCKTETVTPGVCKFK